MGNTDKVHNVGSPEGSPARKDICPDENSIVDDSDVEGGLLLPCRKQRNLLPGFCGSPDEKC